jgi:hypothetical protein
MSTSVIHRKRLPGARCKRHGLVLVDVDECALCKKSGRRSSTSPWVIASLGGVVLAGLFGARWLDEPKSARDASEPGAKAHPTSLTSRVERSRPVAERTTSRREPLAPPAPRGDPSLTRAAAEPTLADESPESQAGEGPLSAEDRHLAQPLPGPEPAPQGRQPAPPSAPGARGFPPTPREDDPADFE